MELYRTMAVIPRRKDPHNVMGEKRGEKESEEKKKKKELKYIILMWTFC